MSIATPDEIADLIEEVGENIDFKYISGRVVEESTGDILSEGVPVYLPLKGYPASYMAREVDGTNIKAGDSKLIVESSVPQPEVGWEALIENVVYRVMDVKALRMAGVTCANVCQVRRR